MEAFGKDDNQIFHSPHGTLLSRRKGCWPQAGHILVMPGDAPLFVWGGCWGPRMRVPRRVPEAVQRRTQGLGDSYFSACNSLPCPAPGSEEGGPDLGQFPLSPPHPCAQKTPHGLAGRTP